jgi:hypothetical protein
MCWYRKNILKHILQNMSRFDLALEVTIPIPDPAFKDDSGPQRGCEGFRDLKHWMIAGSVCIGPSYLAISHVRDQLIAPADRQRKAGIWSEVVEYIRHQESRVREEIQHIAGDEFRSVKTVYPQFSFPG